MKSFLSLVIISAVLGSVLCGTTDDHEENKKFCSEKHSVKLEDAKNAIQGKTSEADVPANVKCFFLCMAEKCNLIKNGAFQPQVLIDFHSADPSKKDVVAKLAVDCIIKGADDCDTGFKVSTCIDKTLMISQNM